LIMFLCSVLYLFFFSSRRRHTRSKRDWSSDVCSSDLNPREKVINGHEIVVLFGETSMSVDGVTYLPETGVPYGAVLEWAEGKYRSEERRVGKEGRCRVGWGVVSRRVG